MRKGRRSRLTWFRAKRSRSSWIDWRRSGSTWCVSSFSFSSVHADFCKTRPRIYQKLTLLCLLKTRLVQCVTTRREKTVTRLYSVMDVIWLFTKVRFTIERERARLTKSKIVMAFHTFRKDSGFAGNVRFRQKIPL